MPEAATYRVGPIASILRGMMSSTLSDTDHPKARSGGRLILAAGLIGAVLDAGWCILYLIITRAQSEPPDAPRVAVFAVFVALVGAVCLAGAITGTRQVGEGKVASVAFIIAGAGNVGVGVLALPSTGLPLVLVGAFLLVLGNRLPGSVAYKLLSAAATVAILALGVVLT
jgi:hypothetical protein